MGRPHWYCGERGDKWVQIAKMARIMCTLSPLNSSFAAKPLADPLLTEPTCRDAAGATARSGAGSTYRDGAGPSRRRAVAGESRTHAEAPQRPSWRAESCGFTGQEHRTALR